jgi:hypothetical protein
MSGWLPDPASRTLALAVGGICISLNAWVGRFTHE